VRVEQQQDRREDEPAAGADDRPERADADPEQDQQDCGGRIDVQRRRQRPRSRTRAPQRSQRW
jgi:hypothetical protein